MTKRTAEALTVELDERASGLFIPRMWKQAMTPGRPPSKMAQSALQRLLKDGVVPHKCAIDKIVRPKGPVSFGVGGKPTAVVVFEPSEDPVLRKALRRLGWKGKPVFAAKSGALLQSVHPTQKFHKTMTRWLHRNGAPFFPVLAVMHDARVLLNYRPACNLPGRKHGYFWLERGGMAPNKLVGDE